ncbi:hypothetical protein LZ30DRAFT_463188 [Colletotrichum cereale]|nr:hypothetical protein LZ30DRAFT_463188 [Colletotrichum cereale]
MLIRDRLAAPAQDSKAVVRREDQKQNKDQAQAKNIGKNKNNHINNINNNNNNLLNGNINVIQNIVKPNIIVVQENLGAINQLQRQNELALAALVQSQLALVTQLQSIKDTIRINHFKAQFPRANTVIVTVTGLVDNRNQGQQNQRYLVNQLLADNGAPGNQTLVMVTDPTPMQISTAQAASSQANAFGAANVQLENAPAVPSSNSGNSSDQAAGGDPNTALNDKTLNLAAFDQSAPFGQIGQSVILPAGTQAPKLASVPDPASIILPGQQGLFVQNAATFISDCATSAAGGNQALAGIAAQVFSSFQQIAAVQLAGLSGLGIYNANQGKNTQQAPQALPPPVQAQPVVAQPPVQAVTQPQASAPPAQAVAPATAPAAAVAPVAAPAPAPQAVSGSGVVIVGSTPGGPSVAQPQAAPVAVPAAAPAAASQPA